METIGNALTPQQKITVPKERELFTEDVAQAIKEIECIPEAIARSMAKDYRNDIEWGRLFSHSARATAKKIVGKYSAGYEPISLNPVDDDEENDLC